MYTTNLKALLAGCVLLWSATPFVTAQNKDVKNYPQWKEGELEIHQIAGGIGESEFMIFPDGTTLLLDVGRGKDPKDERQVEQKTSPQLSSPEYIARYILRTTPARKLDYVMISHFHDDHMGNMDNGQYLGVNLVEKQLPISTVIDRNYPDYNYPAPLRHPLINAYRAYLDEAIKAKRLKVEAFVAGRTDQIVLKNQPNKYVNLFQWRNIGVNGEVWTGVGTVTRKHIPDPSLLSKEELPSENQCSASFKLSYGKFDYYNGGDISSVTSPSVPQWNDIERPVAQAVGQVEACVLNHHGFRDGTSEYFVSILAPLVYIIPAWGVAHPDQTVLTRMTSERLYPGPRDIYATAVHQANYLLNKRFVNQYKSQGGHIVIKVAPGGDSFTVYVLDDEVEKPIVKYQSTPYSCK